MGKSQIKEQKKEGPTLGQEMASGTIVLGTQLPVTEALSSGDTDAILNAHDAQNAAVNPHQASGTANIGTASGTANTGTASESANIGTPKKKK
jgi:hypothetical protein